jgi:ornithine cyclodeaminase
MLSAKLSPVETQKPGMLTLDAATIRECLDFKDLIEALRQGFIEGCHSPLRHSHTMGSTKDASTLLVMPAWQEGGYLGVKLVVISPHNAKLGLPVVNASYVLADSVSGRQLALLDGTEITPRRTAAASALAGTYLARPDASSLLIVGSGKVGSLMAQAYQAIRPIDKVSVWSQTASRAADLARQLRADGFDAVQVDDLEAATARADIISCATPSIEPLIKGEWLRPGVHVDLIGGYTPQMREVDDTAMRRATVFIDTEHVLEEAGDLIQPINDGVITVADIKGTLETLCRGEVPGRQSAEEITLFKSAGSGLEDLAAALLVYNKSLGQ